jgi:hypothetical protein
VGRFDAAQAERICDERAEVLLVVQFAAQHAPDIQGIHLVHVRILHRPERRHDRQLAHTLVPMFAYGSLSYACRGHLAHFSPRLGFTSSITDSQQKVIDKIIGLDVKQNDRSKSGRLILLLYSD